MKTRLPKTLLLAVLAAMATVAEASIIRPYEVYDSDAGTVEEPIDITANFVTGQNNIASYNKLSAYAKDGSGAAKIESAGEITLKTRLLVREGTLLLNNTKMQIVNDGSGALMVGGQGATPANLIMNNSHWVGNTDTGGNSSVNIGNGNGNGSVTLDNGSSITVSQALFMGHEYSSTLAEHMYQSYESAATDNSTVYKAYDSSNPTPGHGELTIKGGSTVTAGTAYYLGDATINVIGEGSTLKAATRSFNSNASMGRTAGATTDINITEGGQFIMNANTQVGRGSGSTTTIDVESTDKGSLFKSTHQVLLGDKRNVGATSKSTITVHDGGTADIAKLVMHGSNHHHDATVDIKEGGSYKGFSIEMNSDVKFTNNGTVELTDGTTSVGTAVASALTMNGGTFTNNGGLAVDTITLNGGELILGDASKLTLTVDNTAALIFGDAEVLKLATDDTKVHVELVINDISTYSVRSASTDLILAKGNETQVNAFYELLGGENVSITYVDTEGEALKGYSLSTNDSGQLVLANETNAVPEPTTATLSLLALAGLCARRRRR